MNEIEVKDLLLRMQIHYQDFKVNEDVVNEWYKELQNYDLNDVTQRFEEHLRSEKYGNYPPKLFNLIRNLRTKEDKAKTPNDYLVRCDLCGREMRLSEYDNRHRDKCLAIKSLQRVLKEDKGEDVSYEEIDQYDIGTIERTFLKYRPMKDNLSNILRNF